MKISIGIKAFNEERNIAVSIKSALDAVVPWNGEVVLADCGSTDRTVDIAKTYPIRVVQLADPSQRSCGAAAQLAFQHSAGDYLYLLDGDMQLDPAFLSAAMDHMEANPGVAGVGGRVVERHLDNLEFQIRVAGAKDEPHRRSGTVDRLDGGGLYRRSAIQQLGYFTDRNLHSFEEFELGARLRAAQWQLVRMPVDAVQHYGHRTNAYRVLWRKMADGYTFGGGEALRAAVGAPHLAKVLQDFRQLRLWAAVIAWWIILIVISVSPMTAANKTMLLASSAVAPIVFLSWRRKSIRHGFYSMLSWNLHAFGFLVGLLRSRQSPRDPIHSRILREPSFTVASRFR